jgi:F5/8 type C domain.
MVNHKTLLSIIAIAAGFFAAGCKEEHVAPLPDSETIPQQVSNVKALNINGGAKIFYVVPPDPNLMYVEAEWEHKGIKRNSKASYYGDTLLLEGFGDTLACNVTLYSVNKKEMRSASQHITVKPLTPPVKMVRDNLKVKPDFGGVNVTFENATGGDIVIVILAKDANGETKQLDAFYTGLARGEYNIRGLKAQPYNFGFYVKDRWGNLSDTLMVELTPLFEAELDKTRFKELNPYPGDVNGNLYSAAYPMRLLFDGKTSTIFVTAQTLSLPLSFSIDLGVKANLSRMKYFQRQSTAFYYSSATPEEFEVYGSNSPAPDGDWNSWTLLGKYKSVKPSGLPLGQTSNDDIELAKAGEDFNFPLSTESYRYLRMRVTKTYGNAGNVTFSELSFWGAY